MADSTVVVHGTTFPTGRAAQLSFVGLRRPVRPRRRAAAAVRRHRPRSGARRHPQPRLRPRRRQRDRLGALRRLDGRDDRRRPVGDRRRGRERRVVRRLPGARGLRHRQGVVRPRRAVGPGRRLEPGRRGRARRSPGPSTTCSPSSRLDETAPAARIPAFIKAHGGDGPGFFTIGFGCDGRAVQHGRLADRHARRGHDVRPRGSDDHHLDQRARRARSRPARRSPCTARSSTTPARRCRRRGWCSRRRARTAAGSWSTAPTVPTRP